MEDLQTFADRGYVLLRKTLLAQDLADIRACIERVLASAEDGILRSGGQAYGVRNLLQLWPGVVDIVRVPRLHEFARQNLGEAFGVVRALLFDKPPAKSWTLPWHRDRTIAVKGVPKELGDFRNPTRKSGVYHLNAPNWLLSEMLTLRVSLDPMTKENGPLVVLPGSHRYDDSEDSDLESIHKSEIETVLCEAGDTFAMRPLLAHSSLRSAPTTPLRRRVVHIELSGQRCLPGDIRWNEFVQV